MSEIKMTIDDWIELVIFGLAAIAAILFCLTMMKIMGS